MPESKLLQLESHDNLNSIRGKIARLNTRKVILVWPRRGKAIRDRLDLVLLQRACLQEGVQAALVGLPDDLRAEAEALSIPCFNGIPEAMASNWRYGRNKRLSLTRKRIQVRRTPGSKPVSILGTFQRKQSSPVSFSLFAIGILAILLIPLFLLPKAEITIHPQQSQQFLDMIIWANPSTRSPGISGAIPANRIDVVVEAKGQKQTTGNMLIPEEYASGSVVFTNLTTEEISVPKGTVVLTLGDSPTRFQTVETIRLPPGIETTQAVNVRAVVPGPAGNVDENAVRAIEGEVGLKASVTNPSSFSGGTERMVSAPSNTDDQQLYDQVMEDLRREALREVEQRLNEGQLIISQSLVLDELLGETRQPPEGSAGDTLSLTVSGRFNVMVYSGNDEARVIKAALDASLPTGFEPVNGSLAWETIEEATFDGNSSTWKITASRAIRAERPVEALITGLVAKRPDEASLFIQKEILTSSPPDIMIFPKWWRRLPFLPFRIHVNFADA